MGASRKILFLDMDDVLTNWKGHITALCGGFVPFHIPQESLTPDQKQLRLRLLEKGVECPNFWEQLPMNPGADIFFNHVRHGFDDTYILSQYIPQTADAKPLDVVRHQKQKWVHCFLDSSFPADHIWVTDQPKESFISPHAACYLVDDNLSHVNAWVHAGGIGVHHINFTSTLKTLKEMGLTLPDQPLKSPSLSVCDYLAKACPYHKGK